MVILTINAFLHEAGAEILKSLRMPEFIIPTLVMPVSFYTLFAVALPSNGNSAAYLLATFGVFAVMGPSIFGFGAGVANERDRGWLDLKRASPAPALSYISAKLAATLVFAAIALMPIYAVAGFAAGVEFDLSVWAGLAAVHLLSVVPFIMIGLILGFLFSASAAVAISNIVFMALSALGGLWMPIFIFPPFMQSFAQILPSYHLGEIALAVSGAPGERLLINHLTIVGISAVLLTFAATAAWKSQRAQ